MLELVTSHRVAVDVVNRLRLFADPGMQAAFRRSEAYGRESIEDWIADSISANVKPEFALAHLNAGRVLLEKSDRAAARRELQLAADGDDDAVRGQAEEMLNTVGR